MVSKAGYLVLVIIGIGVLSVWAGAALAGNGANFVLYNHHTAEAGEMEVMLMSDFGQDPDGTRYTAQMVEFELGVTDRWTMEFMVEGQATFGEGGYNFTGFRLENRYRLFEYGTFLNPVIYVEYESLSDDTLYLMEMSGREDASVQEKNRPRERVLESRLILAQDITANLDVSVNWLNESDLDTGVTSFGYAVGLNYKLSSIWPESRGRPRVIVGLEFFGGVGDSDRGITVDPDITQHYMSPNMTLRITDKMMVKLGAAIGLTNVSQDLVRTAFGYEF